MKVKDCELVSVEEVYHVKVLQDDGSEVVYKVRYAKEENVSWDCFEVLDEDGNDVPEGTLKEAIIESFENCVLAVVDGR